MGIFLSIVYFSIFIAVGCLIASLVFSALRPLQRIWLGAVAALALLMILPALWALLFGFTLTAQYAALMSALLIAGICVFIYRRNRPVLNKSPWKKELCCLILLPFFLLGAYLFYTHIIMERSGALYVGQSTFGDLAMHLGFITSIAEQGTFPPEYSIFPGVAVGYPFLCNSLSASFYLLGAPLRFSVLLPSVFAYALVLMGIWFFFESWLKKPSSVIVACLLFLLGGGFGFAYFFDGLQQNPENLTRAFTAFYNTPTNFTENGLRWVNPIADMLIPQRATLFGWALLFPALFLLRRAAFEGETQLFLPLGLLAGCMPMVHTHSFLALGILSAFYLLRDLVRWKEVKPPLFAWIKYAVAALILAAPQLLLFTFRQSGGFLKFNFNWANDFDSFLWFYVKNWGLLFLLLPLAFLGLEKKERGFFSAALLLWFIAEFIQFQPNPYDNNKLIFVSFIFICGIVADFLCGLYARLSDLKGRKLLAAMLLIAMLLSGTMTLAREAISRYQLFSKGEAEAAEFIKDNTEADALFLTQTNHNNLVAALTGRNIFCGTGSYLYYHGIDYSERERLVEKMYTEPELCFEALADEYGIDYVLFSSYERGITGFDEYYFRENCALIYENAGICIYKTSPT